MVCRMSRECDVHGEIFRYVSIVLTSCEPPYYSALQVNPTISSRTRIRTTNQQNTKPT